MTLPLRTCCYQNAQLEVIPSFLLCIKGTPSRDSHRRSTWPFIMKSLLLLSVIFYIMVQIEAYRLPGLGHFKKSNEPHPTLEIGKFLYSLRNVHDLFKTSSNQMQGTRDGPTIPPSSQISINEGKTVISIGASEKKRSSRSQFFFFDSWKFPQKVTQSTYFFRFLPPKVTQIQRRNFRTSKKLHNLTSELMIGPIFFVFYLKKLRKFDIGTFGTFGLLVIKP